MPTPHCEPGKLEDLFFTFRPYWRAGPDPGTICYVGVPEQAE